MRQNCLPVIAKKIGIQQENQPDSVLEKEADTLKPLIRFAQGEFTHLRNRLLQDLSREHFAILLARLETAPDGRKIFVVLDSLIARDEDLVTSSLCQVRPKKEFIGQILMRVRNDLAANAIIDVHTHPFSSTAHFSGVDDSDERAFSHWLHDFDEDVSYGSLLLSRDAWEARIWQNGKCRDATVKTQTQLESIPHIRPDIHKTALSDMQSRTALALGVDTIRHISSGQTIVLAGVGGIGSVLAEQLIRSGFTRIGLIDSDNLELTNLNRFAGGFVENLGQPKVEVVKDHLLRINPSAEVIPLCCPVEDNKAQSLMSSADWIIVSTDSHSSRQTVQQTALRYGVPLISAGVAITVENRDDIHRIADRSGEVIVARHGDGFCLHCLGRINPYKVAMESNADPIVRASLVQKGYVQGIQEKEPAVMPLNAVIASIAVQSLLDQYRTDATHHPILVYESHAGSCCYPDTDSLNNLQEFCPACGRNVKSMKCR